MESGLPLCVVGAGPCGSAAALALCRAGFRNVKLIEKKPWPRQKTCAGGLGPRAREWLGRQGLLADVERLASRISSLHFTAPSGKSSRLVSPRDMALVVPRDRFDDFMVQRAVAAGARFFPSVKVAAITREKNGAVLSTAGGDIEAAAVVVAAGAVNNIRGVTAPAGPVLDSIMARYADFPHSPFEMEMIFSRELSPFYAWVFPEPGGRVNIGLMARKQRAEQSLHDVFDGVLERHFASRLTNAKQVGRRTGAPVRCAGGVGRVVDGCVLLAGESAGIVHGATGEGISYALESGEIAGRAVAAAAQGGGIDHKLLLRYRAALRRRFSLTLRAGAAFNGFIGSPLFAPAADLGTLPAMQRFSAFVLAKV